MYSSFEKVAEVVGRGVTTLKRYRSIGLLDDIVTVEQKGKVKHIKIEDEILDRISEILILKAEGFSFEQILQKLVPISVSDITLVRLLNITIVKLCFQLSDALEEKFISQDQIKNVLLKQEEVIEILERVGRKELIDVLIFDRDYKYFEFDKFEELLFQKEYLRQQRDLRKDGEAYDFRTFLQKNMLKSIINSNRYEYNDLHKNFDKCLTAYDVQKDISTKKYVITYFICDRNLDKIQFQDDFKYLTARIRNLIKSAKRKELMEKKH